MMETMVARYERKPASLLGNVSLQEMSPVRTAYQEYVALFEQFILQTPLVKSALHIALIAHEGQERLEDSFAYINHPYEAAILGWIHMKDACQDIGDEELLANVVATLFIHDVIEMNNRYTPEKLSFLIELGGTNKARSQKVAHWVEKLTPRQKPAQETKKQWQTRKITEAGRLLYSQDQVVNIAKAADILANATETLRQCTKDISISREENHSQHLFKDQIFVFQVRNILMQKRALKEPFLQPFATDMAETMTKLEEILEN